MKDSKGINVQKIEDVDANTLVQNVQEKYKKSADLQRYLQLDWLIQMSYVSGDQYKYVDGENNIIKEFSVGSGYEEREVFNKIRNIRNTYVGKITMNKAIPKAKPSSAKKESHRKANITNSLLKYQWNRQNMDDMYDDTGLMVADYGSAFWKVGWDSQAGKKVLSNIHLMLDEIGDGGNYLDSSYRKNLERQIKLMKTDIYEGDVFTKLVAPFNIFVDNPTRRTMEELPWIIEAYAYPVDYAKRIFGRQDLESEEIYSITMQEGSNNYGYGYQSSRYSPTSNKLENMVSVVEYYERPTNEFPNGRLIIIAGKKVVYYGELPYLIGEEGKRDLPFIRITATKENNNFFGVSPISDIRPHQRIYNGVRNRMHEALNRQAIGQYFIYENSLHDQSRMTNRPGQNILLKSNKPIPQPVVNNVQTEGFQYEINNLNQEMYSTSGLGALAIEGDVPSNIRSATQFSMLTEETDIKIGLATKSFAKAVRQWAKMTIRLYKQYVVDDRLIHDEDGMVEDLFWNKDLINDNIYIYNESSLNMNPITKKQTFIDLMQMGVFNEQNPYGSNIKEVVSAFGLNFEELKGLIPYREDIDKAENENQLVVQGFGIQVDEYDNHKVHFDTHRSFIVSKSYAEALSSLPQEVATEVDKAFRQHIKGHEKYVNRVMAQAEMIMKQQQQQ